LPGIEDSSVAVGDRLEALGLEPVLIGALAARRDRLTPRFTTDVDVLVRWLEVALERAVDGSSPSRTCSSTRGWGGRPPDRDDMASILATGRPFDEDDVAHWTTVWGMADRWALTPVRVR
jgi:hypothetical protein